MKDDLKDCERQSSRLMKAARLRKLQKQADFCIPSVEVEKLASLSQVLPSVWLHKDNTRLLI
jgi:hypothetical protein